MKTPSTVSVSTTWSAPGSPASTSVIVVCGHDGGRILSEAASSYGRKVRVGLGDHEHALAREQQAMIPAVQGDRVNDARDRRRRQGIQPFMGNDEHQRAVRLDDVGLVDARLLDVRAREGAAGVLDNAKAALARR